jgi:hypothetical protein
MVHVAIPMKTGKDLNGFLPTVLRGEPSRAVGEEEKTNKENEGRDHLNTPRNAESRLGLIGIAGPTTDALSGTELDEVLDQDATYQTLKLARRPIDALSGTELDEVLDQDATYQTLELARRPILMLAIEILPPSNRPLLQ